MKLSLYGNIAGFLALFALGSISATAQQATAPPAPPSALPAQEQGGPVTPPQETGPASRTPKPEATPGIEFVPTAPQAQNAPGTGSPTQVAPLEYYPTQSLPGNGGRFDPRSQHAIDRLRRILVLRQLLNFGFTNGDIAAVLPLLRSLQSISGEPPADPDKAIEDEYQALLLASPGSLLPPSSATKITDAARYYREEQGKIWGSITRKLGARKADGLRTLLGQDRVEVLGVLTTPSREGMNARSGSKPAPKATRSDNGAQYGPAGGVSPRRTPDLPRAGEPDSPLVAVPGSAGSNGISVVPAAPESPETSNRDNALEIGEFPRTQSQQKPGNFNAFGQNNQNNRFRKYPTGQNYNGNNAKEPERIQFTETAIRISLAELIDLLQEKLNAMSANRARRE